RRSVKSRSGGNSTPAARFSLRRSGNSPNTSLFSAASFGHGDLIAFFVVAHLIHEGANEEHAAAAWLSQVRRICRIRQAGGVETGSLVGDDISGGSGG